MEEKIKLLPHEKIVGFGGFFCEFVSTLVISLDVCSFIVSVAVENYS